jgi:carboxyl-terminal processing protease
MDTAKFGLCLTTAKFYSPSGRAISRNGVIPTIKVQPTYIAARPNESGELTSDLEDSVLQRAMEHFNAVPPQGNAIAKRGVVAGTP